MTDLTQELQARGLIEQSSAEPAKILSERRTVYLGIDPTADSMHAGNLLGILLMKRLADEGHKLVLLIGGGTGMIGDPKEKGERPLQDVRAIAHNKKAIRKQIQRILGRRVKVVDNADWLLKLKLLDFLRDIGKHFTVNELVKRDIIKRRLATENESISYTEFAYGLLQGYDYLVLNQRYGVDLQIGASDQWTNILSGVELIRRKLGREAYALVTPLVTDASGKKFGKSEGNAVWLDPEKTSPYAFYQFWLNQPDDLVGTYLKFFTFLSPIEIDLLVEMHLRNPGKRDAQKTLAREVTALVHGKEAARRAETVSETLFGDRELGTLAYDERATLLAEAPSLNVVVGLPIVDALTEGGLASSKGDARRLIEGKGVTLNNMPVTIPDEVLAGMHFTNGLALLRKGKRLCVLTLQ